MSKYTDNRSDINIPPNYNEAMLGGYNNTNPSGMQPQTYYPPGVNPGTTQYGFVPSAPMQQTPVQPTIQPIIIETQPYGYGGGYSHYGNRPRFVGQLPPEYWKYARIFLFFFMAVFVIILIIVILGFAKVFSSF